MAHSIETKAYVRDVAALIECATAIADSSPGCIEQDGTLFAYVNGRLKLRQFSPKCGELIHYSRTSSASPRVPNYHIVPTNAPDALCGTLAIAIDAAGRIMRVRQLYLIGQTRIHVDTAKDLSDFVELEIVLCEDQSEDDGVVIAHALMQSLGTVESGLPGVAYIDSLAARQC